MASSFWSVSGECSSAVKKLNLSDSQKNVRYIFQLFLKHAPWELFPFVSCQNDVKELLQTLRMSSATFVYTGFFFSISQSMFGTQKAQAKNFAWWVAPLSLGTPLGERKLRRNLLMFSSLLMRPVEGCPKLNQALPLTLAKMEVWQAHDSPWRLDPTAAGKGMLSCPDVNICWSGGPTSQHRLESSEIQAQCTKWLFKTLILLSPMDIGSRGFRLNEWEVCC